MLTFISIIPLIRIFIFADMDQERESAFPLYFHHGNFRINIYQILGSIGEKKENPILILRMKEIYPGDKMVFVTIKSKLLTMSL